MVVRPCSLPKATFDSLAESIYTVPERQKWEGHMKQARVSLILIGIILLLGLAVRVWGIDFGLPYLYHPDEPNKIVMAQTMFKTGDLNPHFFKKPTLFIYLNALAYVPYYLFGKLLGVFDSPANILSPITLTIGVGVSPMPTTVLMGRLLTALFAVASIPLVYLIGKQSSGKTSVGLLAALMMAISPTNVANSRFITSNAFLTFFILVVVWASVRIYQQGKTQDYIIAGLATGLAISSKYPGVVVVLVPLVAHFLQPNGKSVKDPRLYLLFILIPIAFFATTPFALLDHTQFLEDTLFEAQHYSGGHPGMEGNALVWYLDYAWKSAGVIYILAVLEMVRGVYSRSREIILLSILPLVYFLFISNLAVRNDRTFLPMTPVLFVLAASFLVHLLSKANGLESKALRYLSVSVIACLLVVGLVSPTSKTIRDTIRLTTVDSRETARVWIDENIPSGAHVAIEAYSPFVDPVRYSVQGIPRMIDLEPGWYVENGFEYLVFSQGMYGRFYFEPERYSVQV
jgi:4-amino-4-deoxy-L-arabinose transferase-like glycosyltransferase